MKEIQIDDIIFCQRAKCYGVVVEKNSENTTFTLLNIGTNLVYESSDTATVPNNDVQLAGEELTQNIFFLNYMKTKKKPSTNQAPTKHEPTTNQRPTKHQPNMEWVRQHRKKVNPEQLSDENLEVITLMQTKDFFDEFENIENFENFAYNLKNGKICPHPITKKINLKLGTSYGRTAITNMVIRYSETENILETKSQLETKLEKEEKQTIRKKTINRIALIIILIFLWLNIGIIKAIVLGN